MEKHKIKPEEEKLINIIKALEYLSIGWKPYKGNDERIIYPNRENIRKGFNNGKLIVDKAPYTSEQLEYNEKMYKSIAALEILLRNKKIRPEWFDKMNVYDADGFGIDETNPSYDTTKEALYYGIEIATIDFNGVINIRLSNLHGHIIYTNPLFRFKELQAYEVEDNLNTTTTNTIDDSYYTTPEIQIIKALIVDSTVIPLLYKRGSKNVDKLVKKIIEYNDRLGLKINLNKNKIKAILSIIKSPEAKKSGLIPINDYGSI